MAKQDGELSSWLIVGGLFTIVLIIVDLWYSSFGQMSLALKSITWILHGVLFACWVIEMFNFNDPNFEIMRKVICGICVVLLLLVGIHHATAREDNQILIDSKENAEKQRISDSTYKANLPHPKDTVK